MDIMKNYPVMLPHTFHKKYMKKKCKTPSPFAWNFFFYDKFYWMKEINKDPSLHCSRHWGAEASEIYIKSFWNQSLSVYFTHHHFGQMLIFIQKKRCKYPFPKIYINYIHTTTEQRTKYQFSKLVGNLYKRQCKIYICW